MSTYLIILCYYILYICLTYITYLCVKTPNNKRSIKITDMDLKSADKYLRTSCLLLLLANKYRKLIAKES